MSDSILRMYDVFVVDHEREAEWRMSHCRTLDDCMGMMAVMAEAMPWGMSMSIERTEVTDIVEITASERDALRDTLRDDPAVGDRLP